MNKKTKQIKVTLVQSMAGHIERHKACARGLGLRKTGSSAVVEDTPENRGMINKINYSLLVEEI